MKQILLSQKKKKQQNCQHSQSIYDDTMIGTNGNIPIAIFKNHGTISKLSCCKFITKITSNIISIDFHKINLPQNFQLIIKSQQIFDNK